jgi:Tfp pilus assembly protein PilV
MRTVIPPFSPFGDNQSGFSMLFSIFAILVLSVLGMSITAMFSDSMQYQVASHQSLQAAYNAESGYRIVAERIANADDQDQRDAVLTQMHDTSLVFSSNMMGQADINIQSFFYNATTSGSTITANALGEVPSTIPSSGTVLLYDTAHAPATCAITTKSDSSLILTLNAGTLDQGLIFPAAKVQSSLSAGSITLESSPGPGLLPQSFGTFRFCNSTGTQQGNDVYRFEKRTGNTLTGITNVSSPGSFSEANNGEYDCIFMDKFAIITSTGRYGSGPLAVSYKNSYNQMLGYAGDTSETSPEIVPGGEVPNVNIESLLSGTFTDGTSLGQFASVDVDGDDAVTATDVTGGNGNQPRIEAYLGLTSDTPNPFYQYWNSTHFLSYEGQVKIAIGNKPTFSNPPSLYMAGLLFRGTGTSTSTTSYGISFVRTRTGRGHSSDGIPDSIVPPGQTYTPMLVFWDRSGRGSSDDIWLAYKNINPSDPVLSSGTYLKPWSSLLVRIIEAPSIDISDASSITTGDTITSGNISASVARKIGKATGGSVLLLTNTSGKFSTGDTIQGGVITNVSDRDNYIWVMYADTSNHGTANNSALDYSNRLGTARANYSWPINNIQEWDSANDYFTLVQWNENLNISQDPYLERLGTGKELNCILRTNKYVTSSSAWESERWELGINTLGDSATQTYFDDFNARIFSAGAGSGSGGGNSGSIPPIVTY